MSPPLHIFVPVRVIALVIALIVAAFLAAGCSLAGFAPPREAYDLAARVEHVLSGDVAVPREAVEMAARVESVLNSEQVTEITRNYDQYVAEYRQRYILAPRPAESPLAVAEAYLRMYQPGPLPRVFQTTTVYDRNGVRLAEIFDEGMRTWVGLDQISPHLIDAIIATEDATFYTNPGIDIRRVVGALVQNAEAGEIVSGASTITMQLARTLFFSPEERYEQSMERKLFEALLAQDLSMLYAKDEILEMYLNLAHFGRLAYGAEAAAQTFFGKPAADLTLAEATLLAGTPQKPGGYDMFVNFDQVKDRQRVVVSLMVRHGFLSVQEAAAVLAEEVELNPQQGRSESLAPHFVQYVIDEAGRRYPGENVARLGMRIFTTLDQRMQARAEQIVAEQVEILKPQFDLSNAALVALKAGTAEILAMVGSVDFNDLSISGQVNVATRLRQPGSAIKPVLYAAAFDDNLISPASVIWDVQATYQLADDEEYRPRNYDEAFHGPVTARSALANSYNIPAVKLLDATGVDRMLEQARAMGIASLNRDTTWYGLSLTLGGGEVTLLDLTTAFHTLANEGRYAPPQAIRFITAEDQAYNTVIETPVSEQVVSPAAAYLVTDILSDNEARTPAFGQNSPLRLSRPAAAKTGTTTDYRDNWTMGYTRYLTTGVWAGNSDGRPMRHASGVTGAAPIWHAFMEAVLSDPELLAILDAPADAALWEFTPPESVSKLPVQCPAGIRCPAEEYFSEEWLALTEEMGANGDATINTSMRTIYVDRGQGNLPVGACSAQGEEARLLLRLPNGIGRGLPWLEGAGGDRMESDRDYAKRIRQEQTEALEWSERNSRPLYFGACDQAEPIARSLFGDAVLAVSVGGFTDVIVSSEQGPAQIGGPAYLAAAAPPLAPSSSSYTVLGIAHDRNCNGNFVLGQVSNGAGQAVAGVRVVYQDEMGNRQETVTSGQMPGYGSFRFAIVDDSPQHISISLYDSNGAAVSSVARVPHKQGGPTDLGCHYVIWTGMD